MYCTVLYSTILYCIVLYCDAFMLLFHNPLLYSMAVCGMAGQSVYYVVGSIASLLRRERMFSSCIAATCKQD